jgi:asparagine synthase (glutamine-hydrolysing)
MCGIVGILARGAVVDPDVLDRATRSLAHRGPDDEGTVIVRESAPEPVEVGLGNRRLAILDLSPLGHQPMQDPETRNWIVHNGEVYNFREVRAKLEREGVEFRSQSDTEVVLKAYGRWGERCVGEFRGMFAFAIWDAQRKRLFVARDPMGIKPLYYFQSERHFLFASELRTLLGTGLVPRKMDAVGLESYLAFGSVYEPATLIEGVRMLGPGCWLTWERGKVEIQTYWDWAGQSAAGGVGGDGGHQTPDAASRVSTEEIHARIDESVRMQLVSDVPVGVFLSGGIDSSALVGILRRSGVQASTFSIVFREAEFSEAEHSRAVAECFKTDHHEITVSQEDVFAALPAAVGAMDQPTMDGVNTFFVSQQARAAGVKVALSGLGGDELFAGYSNFRSVPRMERFSQWWGHVPAGVRGAAAGAFTSLRAESDQNRKLAALVRENGRLVHPYFLARMLFTPEQRDALTTSTIGRGRDGASPVSTAEGMTRLTTSLEEQLDRTRDLDAVNRVSYLEARCYMLNTLLRDSDFMSMAHGLEVRVPLIDHRLAEDALAVPGGWKLSADTPKPLLVGALRGALPDSIVHRSKRGFTLPFERWVREGLRDEVEASIQRIEAGAIGGRINGVAARRVWSDFLRGATSWTRPWSLFVLERWCARHVEDRN